MRTNVLHLHNINSFITSIKVLYKCTKTYENSYSHFSYPKDRWSFNSLCYQYWNITTLNCLVTLNFMYFTTILLCLLHETGSRIMAKERCFGVQPILWSINQNKLFLNIATLILILGPAVEKFLTIMVKQRFPLHKVYKVFLYIRHGNLSCVLFQKYFN